MAKLKIQTGADNAILREKSVEVVDVGGSGSAGGKLPATGLKFDELVKLMKKVLIEEKGLGLAAPQAGENVRVVLCRMDAGSDQEVLFVMVNPEIVKMSASAAELATVNKKLRVEKIGANDEIELPFGVEVDEEGCLSLPGQYIQVARAGAIVVRFKDGRGFLKGGAFGSRGGRGGRGAKATDLLAVELELHGMNARVVQHEVDHLNGVLICDKG